MIETAQSARPSPPVDAADPDGRPSDRRASPLRRYGPIALIAAGATAALFTAGDWLSFEALERNYDRLIAWRDGYYVETALAFCAAYVAAVALSLPGAIWLTLLGGFLFGVVAGSAMVAASATLGATLIFLAARTSLGATLHERAGPWLDRFERRFREGEVSFLLIMRLVPAIPFFIANLAPAFLGVATRTYVWTTLVGILPATVVYTAIGAGLGEQLERGERPDLGVIFEPHVLGPLLGLAALAALPLVLRKLGVGRPG